MCSSLFTKYYHNWRLHKDNWCILISNTLITGEKSRGVEVEESLSCFTYVVNEQDESKAVILSDIHVALSIIQKEDYPCMSCAGEGEVWITQVKRSSVCERDNNSTSLATTNQAKTEFYLFSSSHQPCLLGSLPVSRNYRFLNVDSRYVVPLANLLQQLPSIRQHLCSCSSQFAQERPSCCCSSS